MGEPQREAFKSAMAASSGATKDQVIITDVFAHSGRRHLLRRQLVSANNAEGLSAGDLLVEFAIIIERHSGIFLDLPSEEQDLSEHESESFLEASEDAGEEQGLSTPVIVIIATCTVLALILIALVIVFVYRKRAVKRMRVRYVEENSKRAQKKQR